MRVAQLHVFVPIVVWIVPWFAASNADMQLPTATVTFSPPELVDWAEFPQAAFMTFRPGSADRQPLIGSTSSGGLISSDGVNFTSLPSLGSGGGFTPFVKMPDGSMHDTGTAGHAGNFGNGTSSHSDQTTVFKVGPNGDIEVTKGTVSRC